MNRRKKIKELEKRIMEKDDHISHLQRTMTFLNKRLDWSETCAESLREEVAALKTKLAERTQLLLEVQDKLLLPELRYNENTGVKGDE